MENKLTRSFQIERTKALQLFPSPLEGQIVEENPPCLSWIHQEGQPHYTIHLYDDHGSLLWEGKTEHNYIVPELILDPGDYTWDITAMWSAEISNEMSAETSSEVSADIAYRKPWRFTVPENTVHIQRISGEELYHLVPEERPRELFFQKDIEELLSTHTTEIEVLKRNIAMALEHGFPKRPMFHRDPNALPYREFFGDFRDYCDRDLVACSLGYVLLQDENAGAHAKELLLDICDWNPNGPCSLLTRTGDEIGLSCARILPAVFDLLYPLLDDGQREYVACTVYAYGKQCYDRLSKLDFCSNPGNSHAGRIPAYMGEAAMVLKGTGIQKESEAIEWLDYALDIYGGIFPHFGTCDGGWAEGAFYSSSYTKWYLPFFSAVERYGGPCFLNRPFYQRVSQYFLHFADSHYENHPFGDGYWSNSNDAEWPGFFAQNPFRVYAERFGPELARQRSLEAEQVDYYRLHLIDLFLPFGTPPKEPLTGPAQNTAVFPEAGFVSLHTDLFHREKDLAVLARASKFGSDSHRHADQGSFAIFYRGISLISPSGYFGRAYGTRHHFEWTNQTKAHNTLLLNGHGQLTFSPEPTGKICYATDCNGVQEAVLDLTNAYPHQLQSWIRTIRLEKHSDSYQVTVRDQLEALEPVRVTYPLHSLSEPCFNMYGQVQILRDHIQLTIVPDVVFSAPALSDHFDIDLNAGEPEAYHVTMPQQYHIYYEISEAKSHDFTVKFEIKDGKSEHEIH